MSEFLTTVCLTPLDVLFGLLAGALCGICIGHALARALFTGDRYD